MIDPGRVLTVNFDDWFWAPDGQQYWCAYGPVFVHKAEDVLGFKPKGSADWYLQVGEGERAVLLAGCRIHSAMLMTTKPLGTHVYDAREEENR